MTKVHLNRKLNVPTRLCPKCGKLLDSASPVDNSQAEPAVGDYSFCLRCRVPLKFTYDLHLELLTPEETVEFHKLLKEQLPS